MSQQVTRPLESPSVFNDRSRKRVCRACDKCRLKKIKCDGTNPCGRCEADNAICTFGHRMKFRNGVYPDGFVEALVQEQEWLNQGLHELYKRTQSCHGCLGPAVEQSKSVRISTHYILQQLGVLKQDVQTILSMPVEESSFAHEGGKDSPNLSPENVSSSSTTETEGLSYFDGWASKSPHDNANPLSTLMPQEEGSVHLPFQDSTRVTYDAHLPLMLMDSNMEFTLHEDIHGVSLAAAYLENVEVNRTFDDLFKKFDFGLSQPDPYCYLDSEGVGSIATSIAGPARVQDLQTFV